MNTRAEIWRHITTSFKDEHSFSYAAKTILIWNKWKLI